MLVTRIEVLSLYKKLMLYSKSLTLTDNNYFRNRITTEFRRNKTLCNTEDISFAFKTGDYAALAGQGDYGNRSFDLNQIVLNGNCDHWRDKRETFAEWFGRVKHYFIEDLWYNKMFSLRSFYYLSKVCIASTTVPHWSIASKHTIDYSRVPKINEADLTEQFVRGGGPGGSAVNKNSNCVVLTHHPTGTVVKCHISRCQDENRKKSREMLVNKLDELLNGENSVGAQRKKLIEDKLKKKEYKKNKIAKLKEEWKKREGLA